MTDHPERPTVAEAVEVFRNWLELTQSAEPDRPLTDDECMICAYCMGIEKAPVMVRHVRAVIDALARVEAAPVEPEREALEAALLNVSVHSAHLPDAPRELLVQLLAKCGQIARAALAGDPTGEPKENET